LKVIDFGKNNYQCEIDFKFDCISPETVKQIVENLHISKRRFSAVSKDAAANQTILTQGTGNSDSPFFQVKIGPDKIIVWTGWHTPYEKWQQWRTSVFADLQMLTQGIPTKLVLACISRVIFTVPADKVNHVDQIPELGPVRSFYARFVPEELLQRYSAQLAFGDQNGSEILSFFLGSSPNPAESNITFNLQWNILDEKLTLEQNVLAHTARSDKLLELFNSRLVSLLVKS
jgi:hypothetical protein